MIKSLLVLLCTGFIIFLSLTIIFRGDEIKPYCNSKGKEIPLDNISIDDTGFINMGNWDDFLDQDYY